MQMRQNLKYQAVFGDDGRDDDFDDENDCGFRAENDKKLKMAA